jgi:hypothetical protein
MLDVGVHLRPDALLFSLKLSKDFEANTTQFIRPA